MNLRNRIDLTRTLLRARVVFGKVDRSYLASGCDPATLVAQLKEALAQELRNKAEMEILSPRPSRGRKGY